MSIIINYVMDALNITDLSNSLAMSFMNSLVEQGAGRTLLGDYPASINLGASGSAKTNISRLPLNYEKFCIRVVISANEKITDRQNIIESDLMPFALYIEGAGANKFHIVASVNSSKHGWQSCKTTNIKEFQIGQWYLVDLVYDMDTLGLYVNEEMLSIQAFPNGELMKGNGQDLYIGTWIDGSKNHFNGKISALQIHDGIPENLEAQIDTARMQPSWFISYKRLSLPNNINLGVTTSAIYYDPASTCHRQDFEQGAIMYHESLGAAFEIHGLIYNFYKNYGNRHVLGYLVSDELSIGRGGRKSLFSKGGIYWSDSTRAHPLIGDIYISYESIDEFNIIGLPTEPVKNISSGLEQSFQKGRMYYKHGAPMAHEVHGEILSKFLSSGGVSRWGFPVSNRHYL